MVDHARDVGHPDVLARHAQLDQQAQAGQRRSAGARGHQLDLGDVLAGDLQAVEDGGAHHDGRAVLVVVEDRDLHALAQLALNIEAVGCLDVFQIDAAEGGLHRRDDFHQLVRVLLVELDVEHIDARELLEQHALAFHDGLARQRADVAQAQHGRAVGDHAHQIATGGVAEGGGRVLHDLLAGGRHAGRIGQRQIVLVDHLLGGRHRDLAWLGELVVFERGTAQLGTFIYRGRGRVLGHQASPALAG
ncbi:hypothetical protein SDC9_89259 [bioreactor metagenome]|uniref:NAD-specific glutamate dehydrogenase n=1 Tax=bioreactor metagenome TaxID=1076179 RepID=A0A644ZVC7_9ZZZZ